MLISKKGYRAAQQRLGQLRTALRAEHADAAALYTDGGDGWHDNPGWDDANRKKGILQGQVAELSGKLSRDIVFIDDLPYCHNTVAPGCVVKTRDEAGREQEFTILGELESTPSERIYSHEAPLPTSLIGRSVGDKVEFRGHTHEITHVSRWSGLETE